MSDRLPIGEERESMRAVLDYLKDNVIVTLPKNVSVIKNGKLIVNNRIDVSAFNCNIYMRVDIMWDEAGYSNYKELGLYGSYGSSYYQMTYIDGILTIKSDDNVEIVIR